jgi:catechol 2,3-dioxygenase-like lactoylglutathione lyase family enzyme
MTSWASSVDAITLFAEDLDAVKAFFADVVELPVAYEDSDSVVYRIGDLMLNYLVAAEADDLVGPAPVGDASTGVRFQLTLTVDDVAAVAARIEAAGTALLRGPEVRPWGPTTATFRDPAGHVWEIAS